MFDEHPRDIAIRAYRRRHLVAKNTIIPAGGGKPLTVTLVRLIEPEPYKPAVIMAEKQAKAARPLSDLLGEIAQAIAKKMGVPMVRFRTFAPIKMKDGALRIMAFDREGGYRDALEGHAAWMSHINLLAGRSTRWVRGKRRKMS